MLTVRPDQQTKGLGKKLLRAAEEYAAQQGCNMIYMTVITLRRELIDWYLRRGFSLTDARRPFHSDPSFGIPKTKLELVELEKQL